MSESNEGDVKTHFSFGMSDGDRTSIDTVSGFNRGTDSSFCFLVKEEAQHTAQALPLVSKHFLQDPGQRAPMINMYILHLHLNTSPTRCQVNSIESLESSFMDDILARCVKRMLFHS